MHMKIFSYFRKSPVASLSEQIFVLLVHFYFSWLGINKFWLIGLVE